MLKSTRTYNGLGQRAIKDATPHDNRVLRAVYDEVGHVLSEAVLQGGTLLHYREYVWLEDRPLAQFTNVKAGSMWTSSVIDYLHTNQLERPLFMTDGAGIEVYRWRPVDAFGMGTHETDVDGDGLLRDLRLGLPGQQWDSETSTWYNYFRDYNGRWGRYVQSDPIGLVGGINTYLYAEANPVGWTDPIGLKTMQCTKPLDALGRELGPVAYKYGRFFYHQYSCVVDKDGKVTCGGQDRGANGEGKPSNDVLDPPGGRCKETQPDNNCFEQCMITEWAKPRPKYGVIPFGIDCQEYDDDVDARCQKQCRVNQ